MAEQIDHAHAAGPDADAAKTAGTPEPGPPTPATPLEVAPAAANSVKEVSLADRLADWGLPSVLKSDRPAHACDDSEYGNDGDCGRDEKCKALIQR